MGPHCLQRLSAADDESLYMRRVNTFGKPRMTTRTLLELRT